MSNDNKIIARHWFNEFWGKDWTPETVADLAAPGIQIDIPLYGTIQGAPAVADFMTIFRESFPDLCFLLIGDIVADGNVVVCRWHGGGTHTGPAFSGLRIGSLPASSGLQMRFSGISMLRVEQHRIAAETAQTDIITAMQQLRIPDRSIAASNSHDLQPRGTPKHGGILPPPWNGLPPRPLDECSRAEF